MIKSCGDFTAQLWNDSSELFRTIVNHPFYTCLSSGTLLRDSLRQYLEQDILYLKEDTKAISLTSEKALKSEEKKFFSKLETAGIALEEVLHAELSSSFQLGLSSVMNPACRKYCEYLIKTASDKSYEESASALLPCYWIYQNAGIVALENSVAGNPYQSWLDTYTGEEFSLYTKEYLQIVENIAGRSDVKVRERMTKAFLFSVKCELDFIDCIEL
jgi:thiaminase (transcriptional activator TenA)